jgi:hypothetical protein
MCNGKHVHQQATTDQENPTDVSLSPIGIHIDVSFASITEISGRKSGAMSNSFIQER